MMGWERSDFLFALLLVLNALVWVGWFWWLRVKGWQWEKANLLSRLLLAIAFSIAIALATIPTKPPFQPHHSFGIGLLSIVLGASIAFWLGILNSWSWLAYLGVFLPFAAPLVLQRGDPFPSLFGMMVGTVLVWFCLGKAWDSFGLTTITLVIAIGLARLHERPSEISAHLWQSLPLVLGFSGWLGLGLLSSWQRYWQREIITFDLVYTLSLMLVLGSALMGYWSGDWGFVPIVLLTCIAALTALQLQNSHDTRYSPFATRHSPSAAVLLWIGLLVISFATIPETKGLRLLSGYGASLAAVSLAWLAAGQDGERETLKHGAVLLVTFSLFRLFAEVYPLRTPRADLYTHYTFVGFLLGATVPTLLAQWMEQGRHIVRELATGFWAASLPITLGAIWGVKAVAGYLAGSIAAALLIFPLNMPTLFAGFASSLPLTALVEPTSDLPRKIRLLILVGVATAFVITLLVDYLVHRQLKRNNEAKEVS
jgi:hypothetical protein